MEFKNQYLTYEEYRDLGGTLDETPCNILELQARKDIDKYTFGRLQNLDKQINEVKVCIYELIKNLASYSKYVERDKSISSENTDGYSISYKGADENVSKTIVSENRGIIRTYLAECKLEDGTPYLYKGVDNHDYKQRYYLL